MKISHISVKNYKGLREAECELSDFVCAIGENNTGKSSLLQALLLFINGSKLRKTEFYDPTMDILITVTMGGISKKLLDNLTEEHRKKLEVYINEETLVLARRYSTDGSSKLRVVTYVPRDPKYKDDYIDEIFKGTKGRQIGESLLKHYGEATTADEAANINTQGEAKEIVRRYIAALAPDQMELTDLALPTGIDNSIRSILPEPVYIAAVKDLADELKIKESTSFGKLLNILLDVIEGDLSEEAEIFKNLRAKLNREIQEDGTIVDRRIDRVRQIENTIQKNLQETFRNVKIELEIPPPEIKTVLSSATIVADDGMKGPVDDKGDGFKRAITFSILRSYVQLSQDTSWRIDPADTKPTREKFLFLFEEPELYLHPQAQNILFDALSLISRNHQVVVTTHSPLFFSADNTTTFLKAIKRKDAQYLKPFGEFITIDLTDISEKDKFQIISFESSNLAFFSNRIVLVEGDSELIIFPHIAQLLDSRWDFKSTSTNLIKISGKGSFKRYTDYFNRFGVNIAVITDLDALLEDFDKLYPSECAKNLRAALIKDIDAIIDAENKLSTPDPGLLKEELQRDRARTLYESISTARKANNGARVVELLDKLFEFKPTKPRLEVLKDKSRNEIMQKKRDLIAELRNNQVYILEKGTIESYYPNGVTGADKPSRAQSFCSLISTGEAVDGLCEAVEINGKRLPEFRAIMNSIFDG